MGVTMVEHAPGRIIGQVVPGPSVLSPCSRSLRFIQRLLSTEKAVLSPKALPGVPNQLPPRSVGITLYSITLPLVSRGFLILFALLVRLIRFTPRFPR